MPPGLQVGDQYKPAELARGEWAAIQQGPPWAVDAWGLGCLTHEVFAGSTMTSVDNLRWGRGGAGRMCPLPTAQVHPRSQSATFL